MTVKPLREFAAVAGLCLIAVLSTLLFIEIALRWKSHTLRFGGNFHDKKWPHSRISNILPVKVDPLLGWIPLPDRENPNHFPFSITANSLRSNGNDEFQSSLNPKAAIVAVGDSFTFGDQVDDRETWPSYLERLTRRKVFNGGVYAYGIDQIYLRAQKLVEELRPSTLVFSFIPEDVDRTHFSMLGGFAKPYFVLKNGQLTLFPPDLAREARTRNLRDVLFRSAIIHSIFDRSLPPGWWPARDVNTDARGVACAILKSLDHLADPLAENPKDNPKIVILRQYSQASLNAPDPLGPGPACGGFAHAQIVDLAVPLRDLRKSDPQAFQQLFSGHMTSQGNLWVAEKIAGASR